MKNSSVFQAFSLHLKPPPSSAKLRPLAAAIGQGPVPPRPIQALPADGD